MGKMGKKVNPVAAVKRKQQVELERVSKGRSKILEVILVCLALGLTWGDTERDGGEVLKGRSVKDFFTCDEASEMHCNLSKRSFNNYMGRIKQHVADGNLPATFQLPAKRGGKNGGNSGRPSIGVNGDVTNDKAESAARRALKSKERSDRDYADYSKAEDGFARYAFPPLPLPLIGPGGLLQREELQAMNEFFPKLFSKVNRIDNGVDTSLIRDKLHSDSVMSTGQRRRVLFHSKFTRQKGQLSNPEDPKQLARSDMMLIPNTWWAEVNGGSEFEAVVRRVGASLATQIREGGWLNYHFKPQKGYPQNCHETEAFRTPAGAGAQDAHQDSRFHIGNVGIDVSALHEHLYGGKPMTKLSTWVARPSTTDLSFKCTDAIQYEQLPVPPGNPGYALAFHSAWPHNGPGNAGKEPRFVLFFAFALNEMAARHTTDEVVYPATRIRESQITF